MMRAKLPLVLRKPPGRVGFSLVEVCLAIGIIGTAFIPLLALLSAGFSTMKDSNVDVKASLIAQKLLAAAQMVPFSKLSKLEEKPKYLDYDGNEVEKDRAVFEASVTSSGTNLLGSSNLLRVTVTLTGPAVENRPRIFSSTVAKIDNLGD